MTLVVSDTLPPIEPRIGGGAPHSCSRSTGTGRASPSAPLPGGKRTEKARCYQPLPEFRIDSVHGQGTPCRIQSSTDSESIEPWPETGFSRPLCPLSNSGKKATGYETVGFVERRPLQHVAAARRPLFLGKTAPWAISWGSGPRILPKAVFAPRPECLARAIGNADCLSGINRIGRGSAQAARSPIGFEGVRLG
jgi:hypothetical protein